MRIRRLLRCAGTVTFVSMQTVCAAAQGKDTREILIEHSQRFGLLLVRAEVNRKPAVFMVDTGSTIIVIGTKLADLSDRIPNAAMFTHAGSGLVGTGVYAQAVIKVGPVVWGKRPIVVMNLQEISKSLGEEIDGILGLDFISEMKFFAVDIKNHRLIFTH